MGLLKNRFELGRVEIVFLIIILVSVAAVGWFAWRLSDKQQPVNSFAECIAAGNPVMESYPEQCSANGQTFTNPDQKITEQLTEPSEMPLGDLPEQLQTVVRQARSQHCTGATLPESELDAKTVAIRGAFIDGMFAQVNLWCGDSGANGLFAYENNAWVFVAATQSAFLCSDLAAHNIPVTYIASCVESEDGEPVANPVGA